MALGTLDRRPPPLFRQGTSAFNKLLVCGALALGLMVADARLGLTQPLRAALAGVMAPVQRVLAAPLNTAEAMGDLLRGAEAAMKAEAQARERLAAQALVLARTRHLEAENAHLRRLLALSASVPAATQAAEVLFESGDLYGRRMVIDRGQRDDLSPGSPVIDERGVLGQVRRVHPTTAEVVLLADRDSSIPVQNARTQALYIAMGGERSAGLALRFVAANADIREGDVLRTSGLDGVYPPGLPVARVEQVQRQGDSVFATVTARPYAVVDRARQVLVLGTPDRVSQARAEAASAAASAPPARPSARGGRP
ncbi:MAG: rod shape-determining protein MreC [Inhella sp.]|jgi:rod shape-determining protein MreC|uniref:rod shape-determining protein MreC n=1 Tax=Inhella sp. TaxID=1921806 RepID=UPI0022C83D3F|nr:rod shape-determining protein MreC [Inhella sp.]MCZ8233915.1 rod shape-determining protein MreC [Inhella sp.]